MIQLRLEKIIANKILINSISNPSFVSQTRISPQDYRSIASSGSRITWQFGSSKFGNAIVGCPINNAQFYIINTYSNYSGGYENGELSGRPTEGDVTCRASFFLTSSDTCIPLTFNNGNASVTISAGAGVKTDPLGIQLPASGWYVRIEFITSINNQLIPLDMAYDSPAAGVLDTDVVYQSAFSLTDNNSNSRVLSIFGVFGEPTSLPDAKYISHRFGMFGDSITENGGTLQTVLNTCNLAHCSIAQAGHAAYHYTSRPSQYMSARKLLVFGAPNLIFTWGVNDFQNSRTSSQLIADLQTIASDFKNAGGLRILISTLTPMTSSSDGWATVGNQTELYPSYWSTYNSWVRNAVSSDLSNLDVKIIDIATAAAEPATNVWKAGYTDDGIHPNSTGYTAIRSAISAQAITDLKTTF